MRNVNIHNDIIAHELISISMSIPQHIKIVSVVLTIGMFLSIVNCSDAISVGVGLQDMQMHHPVVRVTCELHTLLTWLMFLPLSLFVELFMSLPQ